MIRIPNTSIDVSVSPSFSISNLLTQNEDFRSHVISSCENNKCLPFKQKITVKKIEEKAAEILATAAIQNTETHSVQFNKKEGAIRTKFIPALTSLEEKKARLQQLETIAHACKAGDPSYLQRDWYANLEERIFTCSTLEPGTGRFVLNPPPKKNKSITPNPSTLPIHTRLKTDKAFASTVKEIADRELRFPYITYPSTRQRKQTEIAAQLMLQETLSEITQSIEEYQSNVQLPHYRFTSSMEDKKKQEALSRKTSNFLTEYSTIFPDQKNNPQRAAFRNLSNYHSIVRHLISNEIIKKTTQRDVSPIPVNSKT
jgi:hypothetical protein